MTRDSHSKSSLERSCSHTTDKTRANVLIQRFNLITVGRERVRGKWRERERERERERVRVRERERDTLLVHVE